MRRSGIAVALVCLACGGTEPEVTGTNPATEPYAVSLGVDLSTWTKKSDVLYVKDSVLGTGAEVANGTVISVTHTGWLVSGIQAQSNVGKAPLQFTVGTGAVIQGWDLGVVGMKVGGIRRLVFGSALGYGVPGAGCRTGAPPSSCTVPPNSTLIYNIKVVSSP